MIESFAWNELTLNVMTFFCPPPRLGKEAMRIPGRGLERRNPIPSLGTLSTKGLIYMKEFDLRASGGSAD
jgi:hypothetical protein